MWVIKFGGSLERSGALRAWLRFIVELGCPGIVLVPGGGRFADAVRDAQVSSGFDDTLAHRLAISAMSQMARVIEGVEPRLRLVSLAEFEANDARVQVWDPQADAEMLAELPASWQLTSDSLAAWLAARLQGRRLVLVKSVSVVPQGHDASWLVEQGLVDARFPEFVATAEAEFWCLGRSEKARLKRLIAAESG